MFRNKDPLRLNINGVIDLFSGSFSHPAWLDTASRLFGSTAESHAGSHFFSGTGACGHSLRPGLEIIADAELHNRGELLARLSQEQTSVACPDSLLILLAYEKWGEDCADYLLGEYSFAVWDERKRRLFCCRDHFGARPFFYWSSGSRFVFASDPLCLFPIPGIPRELNPAKLGALAIVQHRNDGHPDGTLFRNIFSLPSATVLRFDSGGLATRGYWSPEQSRVDVPKRDEDAFACLRDLLFEAVGCRIRGKSQVAAFLSGGLDSSGLVSIAARCLEKNNRSLVALAGIVPETSRPQFQDEREFINEFHNRPNVTLEYVAPEGGPFDGIEDACCFAASPLPHTSNYLLDAVHDGAVRQGADVILFGGAGEAGPSAYASEYFLQLALGFRWMTLARELWQFRSARRSSPFRYLAGVTLGFLNPDRRAVPPLFLLAPDFLRGIEAVPRTGMRWPSHRHGQLDYARGMMNLHAFTYRIPASRVPQTWPYLDKRVIEFCIAAPGHMKVRNGYNRYLIRRSLDGVLPRKIQWRTTKMRFSPDYPKRYLSQVEKARNFVAAIGPRDPVRGIVDVDRLRHILNRADVTKERAFEAALAPVTIYLICFLRQFSEFRP